MAAAAAAAADGGETAWVVSVGLIMPVGSPPHQRTSDEIIISFCRPHRPNESDDECCRHGNLRYNPHENVAPSSGLGRNTDGSRGGGLRAASGSKRNETRRIGVKQNNAICRQFLSVTLGWRAARVTGRPQQAHQGDIAACILSAYSALDAVVAGLTRARDEVTGQPQMATRTRRADVDAQRTIWCLVVLPNVARLSQTKTTNAGDGVRPESKGL
jgi:hypothetical protein